MKLTIPSIEALLGFTKLSPIELLQEATVIYKGINGNPAFPAPAVDMAVVKADIDNFSSAIAASDGGGSKAIAERNRLAEVLIKTLRQLGKYVETASKDDVTTFLSSGFKPKARGRRGPSSLSQFIRSIKPGPNSGQMVVKLVDNPTAYHYELRRGAIGADGAAPALWTSQLAGKTRPPLLITALTPGTTYMFQVRFFSDSGYSDWSDPVTQMCM